MIPLNQTEKSQMNRGRQKGFLIFLLFLLVLNCFLAENRNRAVMKSDRVINEYSFQTERLSAYQKMTLGLPLNLNKESAEGLTAIPGIGKSLASRIVKERIRRNGFKDINELKAVSGISKKTFLKIAPHVTL